MLFGGGSLVGESFFLIWEDDSSIPSGSMYL